MGRLDDKVVVITGASTGIGRATMERFAAEGATVVGGARTQATLDEALASALSKGGRGMVVAGDLANETGAKNLIDAAVAEYGRIDVLVNNAGVGWAYGEANPGSMGKLHETTTEWWQTVMAINLDSYFYATREALGHMMAAGSGSIVNVASMGGVTGLYDGHTYTAAKGAIVNLTRSLAITYIKDGIRSNAVCPGFVDTPMIESVVPAFADPAVGNALTPIGRPAAPGEIASANLFFASDDSSYCNGSVLVVDGGCTSRSFAG
jgi:meso-butanediol dehydrogenase / (S,S)-butanediol dehydrogenase / diacetyl reductase